ncbi:Tll0287-like domain-containing protein [Methylophaga sulfidovorans]|uniref:Tll0287-like domain-containing protein n=1 Tax=Methylophaga sulfidovorans TaxID=45496 RepID=A0A1I3U034_9GAMM|nr:DUF3365 domain-containing protein [Methylophaga sulfidovorans]SFJ75909.1 Protein of unknown function [Methylophaga sulfidovorans]
MPLRRFIPFFFVLGFSMPAVAENEEQAAFERDAQLAIKDLSSHLKKALMSALQDGGPIEAISVCKLVAPTIADEVSKKYSLDIHRTSLRVRNLDNEADSWETGVLQKFETRLKTGEAIQSLNFVEKVDSELGYDWRYMKAIPTDKVCLSCHGSKIALPVQKMIDQNYPNDMATGYKMGDIRGAFSVKRSYSKINAN